ncbi:sulfatase family protein [Gayadomonas joobiniege]|uniref:sulfatase family protein n=1 Tax=Gayadomonas joobiniege TaxID=1234606 RepID=UPI00036C4E15|nr:arylsulfatase [Gayadomonas joobiniege]
MKINVLLSSLVLLTANVSGTLSAHEHGHTQAKDLSKPNVIYILSDDTGYGDLGSYNPNSKIPTPNLDKMAAQGIRFTDAHSPSSVCTPTRYSVLTGRYAWRSRLKKGVLWGYDPALIEDGRETLASLLKRSGYNTVGIGKWHLGLGDRKKTDYTQPLRPGPVDNGFDYYYGIPASLDMSPYVYFENDKVVEPLSKKIATHGKPRGQGFYDGEGYWRGGAISENFKHIDVVPHFTEKAANYIKSQKDSDKPFFLFFPVPAPHQPWLPTDEFKGKSQVGAYGDFINQMDASIGQLMAALDDAELTQNTIIVFTSDNGSHWYEHDTKKYGHSANYIYRGLKGGVYEGGHRVPFIVQWPAAIPAGQVSDQLVNLTDFMATLADITGTQLAEDAGEDSVSLLPILTGKQADKPVRESTIVHSVSGMFAILKGPWKLIDGATSGGFGAGKQDTKNLPPIQLFNLDKDPSETTNVYDKHPKIVKELLSDLERIKNQS